MGRPADPKVRAFVHEYVWGDHAGNGTECALAAGYGKTKRTTACRYGWELLRRADVRELVEAEQAERKRILKSKALNVLEVQYRRAMAGSDVAAVTFLRACGELKDSLAISGGVTLEQAVLAAEKLIQAKAAKATETPGDQVQH